MQKLGLTQDELAHARAGRSRCAGIRKRLAPGTTGACRTRLRVGVSTERAARSGGDEADLEATKRLLQSTVGDWAQRD